MRFSDDFINKVRDASNLVDIISQNTELKRSGGTSLQGLCPFPSHREKTPSFHVSEDKQVYFCFGCKKGGTIYNYLQEMRGFSFPEAVEYLAERASIPLPKEAYEGIQKNQEARDTKKTFLKINKLSEIYFRKKLLELPKEHPVLQYMLKRGLSSEIAEEFKIGYAPADWTGLTQYLAQKNAPMDLAEKLGLIRKRTGDGQSGHFDLFRDRLMFPILSPSDEVIGFGGRVLDDSLPKYLNSPESPVFHKGQTLYGLNATAKHIRASDEVIVVEGYMDLLALYSHGVRNVVATLGTALTHEHAKLLLRFTRNVVVLFDGDRAGQDAATRSLPILLEEGLLPRGLTLPDKQDPDDAIKQMGAESFLAQVRAALDLFVLEMDKKFKGYSGQPSEKVKIFEEMAEILHVMKDVKLRALYAGLVRERLGADESWFRLAWQDFLKKQDSTKRGQVTAAVSAGSVPVSSVSAVRANSVPEAAHQRKKLSLKKAPKEEILVLNLMLSAEVLLQKAIESKVIQYSCLPEIKEIFEIIEKLYGQDKNNFAKLAVHVSQLIEEQELASLHLEKHFGEQVRTDGEKLLKDGISKMKNRFLKSEAKKLAVELKTGTSPEKLEQFMNIQRERLSLK